MEIEMFKKRLPLWRESHLEVKTDGFGALLEVELLKNFTPLWCEAHFEVNMYKAHHVQSTFGGAKRMSKSKCTKHHMFAPLLDVEASFCVAGAEILHPAESEQNVRVLYFVAFPKTMAGVGHLKRICKDAFSVAGAVQKTCSSEMLGGQGADFLRGVAFWSIRSSGLLR